MELKKDLLAKEKKSIFRVVLGVLFVVVAGFWIISRITVNEKIRAFDWIYSIVFTLNGIINILEGFKYNINRLFGRAFITINSELISIKTKVSKKEETVYWKDIRYIDFKYHKLSIEKADNTNLNIDIVALAHDTKSDIKRILSEISENKNITYTTQ